MQDVYIVQLFAILLAGCGLAGLALTGNLYGSKLSRNEMRRLERRRGDDTFSRGNVYRLPFRIETLISAGLLIGGVFILAYTGFEHCNFLNHWLPGLQQSARVLLACR